MAPQGQPLAPGRRRASLRRQLLLAILAPVLALLLVNAVTLYRQALGAANTAYDRTLLASAKAIGELLVVEGSPGQPQLQASLPYAALEAFEADNRSRMFYKVSGFNGEMASGFADLPPARTVADKAQSNVYAALVQFYDEQYLGEPVRMAVLLQPVAGSAGQGMATIQVAETLELRHTLARGLLLQTLWQQLLLVAVIVAVVLWAVQRATAPVRALSEQLRTRAQTDLSPMQTAHAPRELLPMVEATNTLMARLAELLDLQRRFVRDASHQLRTPLSVLKAQVQSARRGDIQPLQALAEINTTVERATELANQMLALAKVEQIRPGGIAAADTPVVDWALTVRAVALDLAPLVAEKQFDFELELAEAPAVGKAAVAAAVAWAVPVRAHEWALRELTRNLLHNAIKQGPAGSPLRVSLQRLSALEARLTVADAGPGLTAEQSQRLFQPFSSSGRAAGSGLGLAICQGIVQALGGRIELHNRRDSGNSTRVLGLDACVTLPLVTNPAVADAAALLA